uniref:Uncharacterized protein n=1 Tax=Kalanchoe fedtschenkoi TaxID=63787 RepID=A0A7N0VFT9_KALFE
MPLQVAGRCDLDSNRLSLPINFTIKRGCLRCGTMLNLTCSGKEDSADARASLYVVVVFTGYGWIQTA